MRIILVLILLCSGCIFHRYDKWEWMAGDLYNTNISVGNCQVRTKIISNKMSEEGVPHYVCIGKYLGGNMGGISFSKPSYATNSKWIDHIWIEETNGKIIDGAVQLTDRSFYKTEHRTFVDKGQKWNGIAENITINIKDN